MDDLAAPPPAAEDEPLPGAPEPLPEGAAPPAPPPTKTFEEWKEEARHYHRRRRRRSATNADLWRPPMPDDLKRAAVLSTTFDGPLYSAEEEDAALAAARKGVTFGEEGGGSSEPRRDGDEAVDASSLSEEELRLRLRVFFDAFDTNASGTVTTSELEAILAAANISMPSEEVARVMKAADVDGSGEMSFDEFFYGLRRELEAGKGGGLTSIVAQAGSFFDWLNPLSWFPANPRGAPASPLSELALEAAALRVEARSAVRVDRASRFPRRKTTRWRWAHRLVRTHGQRRRRP